jgi:predicted enzyme related to lactoylglutathione lyase
VKPGKFVWVDLVTQDVEEAKAFYGSLFGWTFEDGARYTPVLRDGAPIAGLVPARDPKRGSEWVVNLSVADVDRAAALVRERGGMVERGPVDAPDRGRLALVSDPEGALLLLVRAAGGDPPDEEPTVNGWLWRELWTHDADAAVDLYATLAGYEPETLELRGQPYRVLKTGDVPRAGVVEAPPANAPPFWWILRVRPSASKRGPGARTRLRRVHDERGSLAPAAVGGLLSSRGERELRQPQRQLRRLLRPWIDPQRLLPARSSRVPRLPIRPSGPVLRRTSSSSPSSGAFPGRSSWPRVLRADGPTGTLF